MIGEFLRVARASRVLAMASRDRGLFSGACIREKSLFQRDAETNTRDACATQSTEPRVII
jgi:hypothetical protein